MNLNNLRAARARGEAGAWVDNIPGCGDLRLKVRGFGCREHQRANADFLAATPEDQRGEELTAEQREALSLQALQVLLIDWDNLTGDDDRPVPYSPETAARILASSDFEAFRGAVVWAAREVYRVRPDESVADVVDGVAA